MSIAATPLSSATMFAPVTIMSDYRAAKHPKMSDLARRLDAAMRGLAAIAANEASAEDGAWYDASTEAEGLEQWRITATQIKIVKTEFESGLATRRFVREVKKHMRGAAPALETAIETALVALREHLAFAELMAGDEDTTGIEMLEQHEIALRGPSGPIDW